ncbi:MAG: nucleotide exchange factor GrpE [Clostridia bacterium]|nr:nucleotide exchange factor GrpE [Clostridia bacterium]MBR0229041.1 nucleotide exchange factor GrpE [Clostridia bacterium]
MSFDKKNPPNQGAQLEEILEEAAGEAPVDDGALDAEAPAEEQPEQENDALKEAQAKADEYLNMAQRVQADFENFRRRTKATRAEAFEDGAREFIKQLLPVVDNLERATAQETVDENLMTGVKLVYKQLMDALEKRGVTVIDRPGEKFDPNLENAVMQGTADEGEPGTVCAVLQKGYKMGDFVLRHAMVKVVAE